MAQVAIFATKSTFIPPFPNLQISISTNKKNHLQRKSFRNPLHRTPFVINCSSSAHKLVRDPRLDKHVVKQNKIRFVQKLKTLLLSKPKHFMPVHILYQCRPYLSLPKPRSILSMIHRYPTVFEFFTIPTAPTPLRATGNLTQLCVRLTPAAAALAKKENDLKKSMATTLATKLQKLLMLASPHHRLVLSKLVHLGSDLGLPVNFRSRLCNEHPDRFKTVDTSYGRALELVKWDSDLANALPSRDEVESLDLIVDRPLKFKHLRLRKGLNVKRHHQNYLIKFREMPDMCPYKTNVQHLVKESLEAEKRACAVVREVLGMTVEKRTLVDHLTHFRKEFGLPNKLRRMLVRHPEMFYVSLKGQRDSVFLVKGYNDKGVLLEKDEISVIKDELMKLVREGKRMRREKRKGYIYGDVDKCDAQPLVNEVDDEYYYDDCEDGLDDLFQMEDCSSDDDDDDDDEDDDDDDDDDDEDDDDDDDDDDDSNESKGWQENGEFWMAETSVENQNQCGLEPW